MREHEIPGQRSRVDGSSPPGESSLRWSTHPDPMVGRLAQLGQLKAVLAECRRGRSALVELAGDPGTGKTRLLREFADHAHVPGTAVVGLSADPATFSRLDEVLDALLHPEGDPTDAGPAVHGPGPVRSWVSAALADPTGGRGRHPTLVLLLDDLHDAGPQTLRRLAYLIQLPPPGLLVVAAFRPRQACAALRALTATTGMRRHRIELCGLTATDTATLLGIAPGRIAERVHRLSEGIALYVAAWRDGVRLGPLPSDDWLPHPVDMDVRAAIDIELARLDDADRSFAEALSVLDGDFDVALAAEVAGCDPASVPSRLDRLTAVDLLRVRPDQPTARFRHPVVRSAIHASLAPARRRALHFAAARYLRSRGEPITRYAEHVANGPDVADPRSVRLLLAAVDDPGICPSTATRWLRAAYDATVESGQSARGSGIGLAVRLALALLDAGRITEARGLLRQLDVPGASPYHTIAVAARARAERWRGRPSAAYLPLRAALAELGHGTGGCERGDTTAEGSGAGPSQPRPEVGVSPRDRLTLVIEAAVGGALCGAPEAIEHSRLARRIAVESCPQYLDQAEVVDAFVRVFTDQERDPGLARAIERATTMMDARSDAHVAREYLDTLSLLAWTETSLEHDRAALRHFGRALAICEEAGRVTVIPVLLAGRSFVSTRQGDLGTGVRDALDAEQAATAMGVDGLRCLARAYRGLALAWQESPAVGLPVAQAELPSIGRGQRSWFVEASHRITTVMRHESGDRADTLSALTRACGGTDLAWVEPANRACWAVALASIARADGRLDEALDWVDLADDYARRLGLRGQQAMATVARARLCLDSDPARAAILACSAVEVFGELGWLLDEGSGRLLHVHALCNTREWREAEAQVAEARRIAELTGSRQLRRAVASAQRRTGGCAGRMDRADSTVELDGALTPREGDIARLVAAGASNAEAAERLYVSVKTVEAHLTRIFRKLGVSSRAGLIAALAGQVDDPTRRLISPG